MDISGPSSADYASKFIVPDECPVEDERRVLSVDPDYDDDSIVFEDTERPAPITRQLVDSAIERRSKDREGGVKMSIGNYDDMEDDCEEEETEEQQKQRILDGIRNFREKPQESFDLEECDNAAMREYINQQVNSAMMFNTENSNFQHLDFEPTGKRKCAKIIEGYLWGAVIGVGSYGKVKEVIDTCNLTRRAAKIMKYDKLRKITNGWENIRSEMAILRKLNHPNVIRMVEMFNIPSKGKVYMIFEYCIGSVQQLLDLEPARRLTVGESHSIFVEMCHGLNYLHSKRISHKDIKPGNLLVSIDFRVKICDFGVAEQINVFQNDGRCTKVNGTPKFQPPECVYGNHNFFDGYKADMWSAGITLYNLVSGKYPFERPVLLKLYECIGTEPLVMPNNVQLSQDLQNLLTNLLEKDFTRRLGCQETMLHPWFIASFPEDQGLGRIMERMRTGDRPLTMLPSMAAMYDGIEEEIEYDEEGKEIELLPRLVEGGEIDQDTFRGFKFLEPTSSEEAQLLDAPEEDSSLNPARRPSSRSAPTSAPMPVATSSEVTSSDGAGAEKPRRRQKRRGLLACIFGSRTDSV